MSSSRSRVRPARYVWGALSNTEPPDDDDGPIAHRAFDWDDSPQDKDYSEPDERSADIAADKCQRELDARASQ